MVLTQKIMFVCFIGLCLMTSGSLECGIIFKGFLRLTACSPLNFVALSSLGGECAGKWRHGFKF